MTFFLAFFTFSIVTPLHPLYTPTCCFSRFYALLCPLVTINTPYAIYFFLIHHCTNSLSSLHIFVHHCTFCASLHTKTSSARFSQGLCLALLCFPIILLNRNFSVLLKIIGQ